jgi:protein kinase-like protein
MDRERAQLRGAGARVVRVGNYIVERRLGAGGQADVFLARDVVLRRLVALKVLHRSSGPSQNVRGLEEARLIATLDHPNIVRVHHVELSEGVWYMAMEYVDGGNLELRVTRAGALDPVRALRHALVVADALQHAHKIGVVHRDVKPQNLLETRAGVLKLADFGLAGLRQESLDNTGKPVRLVGTPQYLAPEMWLGENATAKSDIYGLGATLYFMLTGRPPFPAKTVRDLRHAHLTETPAMAADTPAAAAEVVLHCMAKNPADRPASASALCDEIQDALGVITGDRRKRVTPRPTGPMGAAGSSPSAAGELAAFYNHSTRAAADAAALRLPVFAAVRAHLEEALAAGAPIVVFHGAQPDGLKAMVRAAVDRAEERRFYVAARTVLNAASPLAPRLVEQLHLGQWPLPAWHDRVCAELVPEASGSASLPSLMEIDVRRPLNGAEATDLIELGRRAEGKAIVFLIITDGITAGHLLREVDASGFAFLVRGVAFPELSDEERGEYVRTWTHQATGDRVRWTDDAIRLLRHTELSKKRPAIRLMHNAIMIAGGAGMRLVTTWSVLGAESHPDMLQTFNDVAPAWRQRPACWPGSDLLALLVQLRAEPEDLGEAVIAEEEIFEDVDL